MDKKLQRSRSNKLLGGVCGGLANYIGIDPTLVRIIWVIVSLFAGSGVLIYLVLWVIMPLELP